MSENDHGAQTTTDHYTIRQWTEERDGVPAVVENTKILRIDFLNGEDDDSLQEISWPRFFEIFDDRDLVFLYQEQTSDGDVSRFFKFVDRETAEEVE